MVILISRIFLRVVKGEEKIESLYPPFRVTLPFQRFEQFRPQGSLSLSSPPPLASFIHGTSGLSVTLVHFPLIIMF